MNFTIIKLNSKPFIPPSKKKIIKSTNSDSPMWKNNILSSISNHLKEKESASISPSKIKQNNMKINKASSKNYNRE